MTYLPYDFLPAVMEVLDKITEGMTETRACDEVRLNPAVFKNYIQKSAELQDMYAEAMQRGHDAMADALLNPDNHALYGHSDSKMAKVQSDNIKWFLEKRDAKRFGQRVQVDHHLTADKAITQALLAARNRVPLLDHDAIDGEIIEVFDENEEAQLMIEMGLQPISLS